MVRITTIDFPDDRAAPIMSRERPSAGVKTRAGGTTMDITEYVLERLVLEKLHDARSASARRARVAESRPPRVALRARVGSALIALGERLAGTPVPLRPCAPATTHHG
jgi:hypothetical protein